MINKKNYPMWILVFLVVALFFTFVDYFELQESPAPTGNAPAQCKYTCRPSCNAGEYETSGFCIIFGTVCCREAVCGNGIKETGEWCDGSDNSYTCVNRGYEGGDIACTGSCTLDESGCHNCGDGVCDNATETCSGCVADCDGEQADCSEGQICELGECVAQAPTVCNDTTSVNTCSSVTGAPWYCNASGVLEQNCTACACASDQECVGGTTCTDSNIQRSTYSGRSFSVTDATPIPQTHSSSINNIDAAVTGTQLSWEGVRRRDKISFEVRVDKEDPESNTETQTVEIFSVFSSEPIEVELFEGEPQRIDLDGDGVEDIVALATDIGLSTFNIDIQEIDPEKLEEDDTMEDIVGVVRERGVYFPGPYLSPVLEESPEANVYEFIVVNSLIVIAMGFYFFNLIRHTRKK